MLLRGGEGSWGQRPRRLQPLVSDGSSARGGRGQRCGRGLLTAPPPQCDGRRGALEHLLHAGRPGGPRGRSNPDPLGGPLHTGLRALQSAGPRGGPQAAGTDPGPGRAHVQLGAAAGICGGDGCLPQEEPLASGASAVPTRPRFSERLPRTWGQEAVSRRVPHQPWLQKKPASGVDFDDL
ncbi:protein PAXX isoform X11 [Phyllostomus hastatus]|uniref:protein PAXX isoform X11 n=1 Tax=Phyllostomus hastatus TaxID=9423 RepID=UPI001E681526|nr:protein PAXX isoform X11 [Phyllostomus hastatus]